MLSFKSCIVWDPLQFWREIFVLPLTEVFTWSLAWLGVFRLISHSRARITKGQGSSKWRLPMHLIKDRLRSLSWPDEIELSDVFCMGENSPDIRYHITGKRDTARFEFWIWYLAECLISIQISGGIPDI